MKVPPAQDDPEVVNAISIKEGDDTLLQLINSTSSWNHLRRVILRFKTLLVSLWRKRKEVKSSPACSGFDVIILRDVLEKELQDIKNRFCGSLSVEELKEAELEIIRACQRKRFPEELFSLRKVQSVKRSSHVRGWCLESWWKA